MNRLFDFLSFLLLFLFCLFLFLRWIDVQFGVGESFRCKEKYTVSVLKKMFNSYCHESYFVKYKIQNYFCLIFLSVQEVTSYVLKILMLVLLSWNKACTNITISRRIVCAKLNTTHSETLWKEFLVLLLILCIHTSQ